jgi:hypothetical protein
VQNAAARSKQARGGRQQRPGTPFATALNLANHHVKFVKWNPAFFLWLQSIRRHECLLAEGTTRRCVVWWLRSLHRPQLRPVVAVRLPSPATATATATTTHRRKKEINRTKKGERLTRSAASSPAPSGVGLARARPSRVAAGARGRWRPPPWAYHSGVAGSASISSRFPW